MGDDWRAVIAEWKGELGFIGKNLSGGNVQMGMVNGEPGVSPMELLLLGVAGCTGMDIASLMPKMRQKMTDLKITVRGKRASDHPRMFTAIEIVYELWGDDLNPKMVEDAIQLSEYKYCSASAMLSKAAEIHSRYILHSVQEFIA